MLVKKGWGTLFSWAFFFCKRGQVFTNAKHKLSCKLTIYKNWNWNSLLKLSTHSCFWKSKSAFGSMLLNLGHLTSELGAWCQIMWDYHDLETQVTSGTPGHPAGQMSHLCRGQALTHSWMIHKTRHTQFHGSQNFTLRVCVVADLGLHMKLPQKVQIKWKLDLKETLPNDAFFISQMAGTMHLSQ